MTNEQKQPEFAVSENNLAEQKLLAEQLTSPEMSDAAAAIGGIGATAISTEVASHYDNQPGFVVRRWNALKKNMREAFDLRTYDSGQAIIEAGVPFSKWDAVRAGLHETFQVSKAMVSIRRDNYEGVARLNSNVGNPVIRKKMTQAVLAGRGAPVYEHLRQSGSVGDKVGYFDGRILINEIGERAKQKEGRLGYRRYTKR